jgi:phosphatidylserine/phosphatidylglycerophosphate/cardiolipin synthase-like enzyme
LTIASPSSSINNSIEEINLYTPKFDSLNIVVPMTLTPIFTPDNALDIYAAWIDRANTSIDLQNQYITQFDDNVDWSEDPSPIVQSLVAAHNRGVTIRVQINEDSDSDDITSYLSGLGIEVRWMGNSASNPDGEWISDTHNKLLIIDGKVVIISSVNFSENAFLNNREAGMVIQNTEVATYYTTIFESDWADGEIPTSPLEKSIIREKSSSNVEKRLEGIQYTSPTDLDPVNFTGTYNVTLFANPDNADEVIFRYLKTAKASIYVSMYTISRPDFNKTLIDLKNANPDLDIQVLISNRRVGSSENKDTYAAAKSLTGNSIPVYNSTKDLKFYHNKYWIIDGTHTFVYSGNWSPRSVAPPLEPGDDEYSSGETNRDMGIAVHDAADIAAHFKALWDADAAVASGWSINTSWQPVTTTDTSTEITSLPISTVFMGIISLIIVRMSPRWKK